MKKRTWISSKKLFWTENEWQEAIEQLNKNEPMFSSLNATIQVEKMIAYLTKKYPVEKMEVEKIKN